MWIFETSNAGDRANELAALKVNLTFPLLSSNTTFQASFAIGQLLLHSFKSRTPVIIANM